VLILTVPVKLTALPPKDHAVTVIVVGDPPRYRQREADHEVVKAARLQR